MLIAYHQVLQRAKIIFVGSVLFAALIFLGTYVAFLRTPFVDEDAQAVSVIFPMGSSVVHLANELHDSGLLIYPRAYLLLTSSLMHASNHLHAGEYNITPGLKPIGLLRKMVLGDVVPRDFLFIEGWTVKQLRAALDANPYLIHKTQKLSDEQVAKLLKINDTSLEGLFFPDTYKFSAGFYDTAILKTALVEMQKRLQKAWDKRAPNLIYQNSYQALIVASMVEKEAQLNADRPRIAGIILKRLMIHMPLQIDASVIYGLGDKFDGVLKFSQLRIISPYNTYLNYGLPPTPISMPGEASIQAAMHPIITKDLFYVANGNGGHIFSSSYSGQDRAVKQYRAIERRHKK